MIEDTKWVKSIVEKEGVKGAYHVVTWHDGKKDTIFDTALLEVCKKGLADQLAVHYFKESNVRESDGKTFWNIVSAEALSLETTAEEVKALPPQQPVQPPPQIDEPILKLPFGDDSVKEENLPRDKWEQYPPKLQIDARTHDIHKQGALKCATRLACAGLIKLSELKEKSDMLLRYLDGE